jgi:NAD(P)-dependent dehydrogenase (short-subunit alcohol dehydrogenase family)
LHGSGKNGKRGAMENEIRLSGWALILGASSGFGEATALELARAGMNVAGVHLDRRATMPNVERITAEIKALGREAVFFNVNAADDGKRGEVLTALAEKGIKVRVLMHSLAFGTLRTLFHDEPKEGLSRAQLEMTLDVMANSLVYWTQDLVARGLLAMPGGRVFAMTSSGSLHHWPSYGAVSAAKSALESHVRQIALELGPKGVTANAIMAGVTDTPALRKIPGNEQMMARVLDKHPQKRLTTPPDVARFIAAMTTAGTSWLTGNTLRVDGGEEISG